MDHAPFGWQQTKASVRAKQLATSMRQIYRRINTLANRKHWHSLRGGAWQIDLLKLGLLNAEDTAVVRECAQLMEAAVRRVAGPHWKVPIKLAQLKLLFCKSGVGRQPLHFDLGTFEHLCFSALMAGCDTVGTHLCKAPLEVQREFFQWSPFEEKHKHQLCTDQLLLQPHMFTRERVCTGDITAFRCDTLHAGPLNTTPRSRYMLYGLFTPTEYAQDQQQGEVQHYPCGELKSKGDITAEDLIDNAAANSEEEEAQESEEGHKRKEATEEDLVQSDEDDEMQELHQQHRRLSDDEESDAASSSSAVDIPPFLHSWARCTKELLEQSAPEATWNKLDPEHAQSLHIAAKSLSEWKYYKGKVSMHTCSLCWGLRSWRAAADDVVATACVCVCVCVCVCRLCTTTRCSIFCPSARSPSLRRRSIPLRRWRRSRSGPLRASRRSSGRSWPRTAAPII